MTGYRAGRIRRAVERLTWPLRDRYESEFSGVSVGEKPCDDGEMEPEQPSDGDELTIEVL